MKGTQEMDKQNGEQIGSGQSTEDVAIAVRWYQRIMDADVSTLPEEELADWVDWSEAKPHLEQYRTLTRIWGCHVKVAANESGPRPTKAEAAADEYDGSVPFSQWIADSSSSPSSSKQSSSSVQRKWRRPGRWTTFLAVAACLIAMTGAVVRYGHVQFHFIDRFLGEQVQSYATGASERRDYYLPDGSHITLGPQTELTVHYTTNRRFIFLDRGEGSFSVAHNPLRPFTVLAGGGAITAIGTQFDVRRDVDPTGGERVVVTVSSGTVEIGPPMATISTNIPDPIEVSGLTVRGVKPGNKPEWTPARLVKGQELTFGTDGPQGKIESVNLEEVAAWKEGRLEYRHLPFRDVIPRVNRYSQKPIVLADGEVGYLPYSGTVFEGQVDDWLRALPKVYPIEVTETADKYLLRYDRDRAKQDE